MSHLPRERPASLLGAPRASAASVRLLHGMHHAPSRFSARYTASTWGPAHDEQMRGSTCRRRRRRAAGHSVAPTSRRGSDSRLSACPVTGLQATHECTDLPLCRCVRWLIGRVRALVLACVERVHGCLCAGGSPRRCTLPASYAPLRHSGRLRPPSPPAAGGGVGAPSLHGWRCAPSSARQRASRAPLWPPPSSPTHADLQQRGGALLPQPAAQQPVRRQVRPAQDPGAARLQAGG